MPLYAASIFLSALLLFQVQPMIAKMILPWFGGSAAVWITCALFFQCLLFLGYLYAHALIRWFAPRAQAAIHGLLAAASVISLPIAPAQTWKPAGGEDPIAQIIGLLAVSVGLPFLVLSSTGPLLQAWCVRRNLTGLPYRLFALSNLASLAGLLVYPFGIEPHLTLQSQSRLWSAGYGVLAAASICAAWLSRAGPAARPAAAADPGGPGWRESLAWLVLSAGGVALMLAVTQYLTQNIAPVPFLWILPLGLYLLSFIICFHSEAAYHRGRYLLPIAAVLCALMAATLKFDSATRLDLVIGVQACGLFGACMFCHGELARRKPQPRHLTAFYLRVAAGGAAGGFSVAVAAPLAARGFVELPLALSGCGLLLYLAHRRARWPACLAAGITAAAMLAGTIYYFRDYGAGAAVLERNFYGSLRVLRNNPGTEFETLTLVHGSVTHGVQFTDPDKRRTATAYYGRLSGAGRLLSSMPAQPVRVGLVGLGAGTLAAYSRPGDLYRFYEINPRVVQLARERFTFLADAAGTIEIIPGDARLALAREPDRQFDVLVIDAFSGDAIPTHLLTREALELYFRVLKPDGVLALHLTNHYLDLMPVADKLARALGMHALGVKSYPEEYQEIYNADWVLVSTMPLTIPRVLKASEPLRSRPDIRVWTDDFSNLFQALKGSPLFDKEGQGGF
jgi:spermidine synthase